MVLENVLLSIPVCGELWYVLRCDVVGGEAGLHLAKILIFECAVIVAITFGRVRKHLISYFTKSIPI